MVNRRGGVHGAGEYHPTRATDYDFWARTSDWLARYHLLLTVLTILGGILGFTVVTPAQSASKTREELHGEIRAVSAKLDTVRASTDVRIHPVEQNQFEIAEDIHIILRYLCVGPGSDQVKKAAGLTPAKCDQ